MASGAELVLFGMWFVSAAPAQGSVKKVALISYCCQDVFYLFSPSSRSVILAGQARKGLALLFFVCKTAWLVLSTLFRTLVIFHREGLIEKFFFQYKVKIVVC